MERGWFHIDYSFKNGEIKSHTLIIDNARSGLWAAPYIDRFGSTVLPPEQLTREQVAAWQALPPAEGYIDKVEPTLTGQRIGGWALLPFVDTSKQENKILFYNDNGGWLFAAKRQPRPGITAHFVKQGEVDLEHCCFNEEITLRQIPAGQYRALFAVVNGEQRAILPTDRNVWLELKESTDNNNVEAVRLRTIKPWAYKDEMYIEWDQLKFTDQRPWQ